MIECRSIGLVLNCFWLAVCGIAPSYFENIKSVRSMNTGSGLSHWTKTWQGFCMDFHPNVHNEPSVLCTFSKDK